MCFLQVYGCLLLVVYKRLYDDPFGQTFLISSLKRQTKEHDDRKLRHQVATREVTEDYIYNFMR